MALQIKNEQILNRDAPVKLPVSAHGDGPPLLEGEKENQSLEMAKNKKKMRGSRGGKKNREKKLKQLKLIKKSDSPHIGHRYSKQQLITIWKCQAEKMIMPEKVDSFEKNGVRVFPVEEETRALISETISTLEKNETREVTGSYPYFMQRQKPTEPVRKVIAEIELEPKEAKEKEKENEEDEMERNEQLEVAETQKALENEAQKAKYPMRPPRKCSDGAPLAAAKVARRHSLESMMQYGMYTHSPYNVPMCSMPVYYPVYYPMYCPGYISPISSRTTSPSLSPTVPLFLAKSLD